MADYINKIDDIDWAPGRAILRLTAKQFFNGDEQKAVESYNREIDAEIEIRKRAKSASNYSEINMRLPRQ